MSEISTSPAGSRLLLLGNEAIARGAIEAGVQVVAAYPGTPSSEIPEALIAAAADLGFYAEWSINEKVAFELAAGAALTGVRSLATMKGAGLNVVMDLFMTLPYGGTRGGLVAVVADDPGAHYSSNEQDSRLAAQWANLPCLEPESQQEAKDMTRAAFALSERLQLPVVLRSATRLSHSSGVVVAGEVERPPLVPGFNKHWGMPYRWNVYGPPGTTDKHAWQLERMTLARPELAASPFNNLARGAGAAAVVACGMGAAYSREALRDLGLAGQVWFHKIGTVYPLPEAQCLEVLRSCRQVLVVEDGDPLVEGQLRALAQEHGLDVCIRGRMFDPMFPLHGELDTGLVRRALAAWQNLPLPDQAERRRLKAEVAPLVIPRSSTLCAGCPHLGTYWAMRKALKGGKKYVPIINGDIGCYEQAGYGVKGFLPEASDAPSAGYGNKVLYDFLDTLYVMGSGVSMAQGQARAGYKDGAVMAVAGDSTFFHACMPALLNAVWNQTRLAFVVMDNSWTAMTGHQVCPATGVNARGKPAAPVLVEDVARGLGVTHIEVVDPYDLEETTEAMRNALATDGVSLVVTRRECTLQVLRREKKHARPYTVTDECGGCAICVQLGCPAISFADERAGIDPLLCTGCGICAQLCPSDAIVVEGQR